MKAATGSHTGTGTWLVQRASAVALALIVPGLMLHLALSAPADFAQWQAWFAPLWLRLLMLLAATALALHAWVGMRDICMDYVRPTGLRLAVYLAVIAVLATSLFWLVAVLWEVA